MFNFDLEKENNQFEYKNRKKQFIVNLIITLSAFIFSIICSYPPSITHTILGYIGSGIYLITCIILSYLLYKEYKWLKEHKDWK